MAKVVSWKIEDKFVDQEVDRISGIIINSLVLNNLNGVLSTFLDNVLHGLMITVSADKQIFSIYAIAIYFGVAYFCSWIVKLIYNQENWFLSTVFAEPLSQGLVAIVFDMALIGLKNLIVYLIKKNKKENEISKE